MRFKGNRCCLLTLYLITFSVWGAYYNAVEVDNLTVRLSKNNPGVIDIRNKTSAINYSCKIGNWNKMLLSGAGGISLTSDGKGLLIASGNNYLAVKDLKTCNGSDITLHSIHYFDEEISSVIDVNFDKQLVLALVVIDAQKRLYQAILSDFNGTRNIFTAKGFWHESAENTSDSNDSFSLGLSLYIGKISSNGKYVTPGDLDCSVDSFPGVWDIEKKKKVVFYSNKSALNIADKCRLLFSAKKTLTELDGRLLSSE